MVKIVKYEYECDGCGSSDIYHGPTLKLHQESIQRRDGMTVWDISILQIKIVGRIYNSKHAEEVHYCKACYRSLLEESLKVIQSC